jgi:hypothetical protein
MARSFGPSAAAVALVLVSLIALFGLVVLGAPLYANAACGEGERATLGEFPHYGGRTIEPSPDFNRGSCTARFATADSGREVFGYYSRQLHDHGWSVDIPEPPPKPGPDEVTVGPGFYRLRGERGLCHYEVRYYPPSRNEPAGESEVVAEVYEAR